MNKLKGMSVIEVIIAMALFAVMAVAVANTTVFSFSSNRLSQESYKAQLYMREGVDAVRNIKKSNWATIANGTYGLSSSTGEWAFSGSSDANGKLTRQITIADAFRDVSGNLATSGTTDPSTKKITVSVTWNYNSTANKTSQTSFYLTNFKRPIVEAGATGMLVYADYSGGVGVNVIKYKILNGLGTWNLAVQVPDWGVSSSLSVRHIELYSSKTRNEKILVSKHTGNGQYTYAQIWNGTSWANAVLLSGYSDNTDPETRNADGFYMQNGNFMVVYDDMTFTPKYKIWNGSSWTSQQSVANVGDYPVWVDADGALGTNNGMVAVRTYINGSKTSYWNGSTWSSFFTQGTRSAISTTDETSITWSITVPSVAGALYNEDGDRKPNIRLWNTSSWGPDLENKDVGADILTSEIISKPNEAEFMGCVKNNLFDITCMKAGHNSSWQNVTNGDIATNTDSGSQRSYSIEYERTGNLGLIVYSDGADDTARRIPKYRIYTPSTGAFSASGLTMSPLGSSSANALKTVRTIIDPVNDNIMVVMGDASKNLYTILWDGSTNAFSTSTDLGLKNQSAVGSNAVDYWYDFKWDNN